MAGVTVIGESALIQGYLLAGATLLVAEDADAVRDAWASLTAATTLVVVTAAAARILGDARITSRRFPALTVVMPE